MWLYIWPCVSFEESFKKTHWKLDCNIYIYIKVFLQLIFEEIHPKEKPCPLVGNGRQKNASVWDFVPKFSINVSFRETLWHPCFTVASCFLDAQICTLFNYFKSFEKNAGENFSQLLESACLLVRWGNKLAKLQATLVWNYDSPTHWRVWSVELQA